MGKLLLEQPPDPREVDEVAWLAVALPQPREDAEDLAVALSRQDRRRSQERRPVERRKSSKIALGHLPAEVGRNVAPGVFEERYEIVARRAAYGVLKIEEAAALHPGAIRQQHQIVDVIVAQHQGIAGKRRLRQKRSPQIEIFVAPRRRITALREPPGHTNRPGAPPRRGAAPRRKGASPGSRVPRLRAAARPACLPPGYKGPARRRRGREGGCRCRRRNPRSAESRAARSSANTSGALNPSRRNSLETAI